MRLRRLGSQLDCLGSERRLSGISLHMHALAFSGDGKSMQVSWSVRANAAPKGKGIRECMGGLIRRQA